MQTAEIQIQQSINTKSEQIKRVFEFLQNAGTFYLATVEGDQRRVMGFFDTAHDPFVYAYLVRDDNA